MNTFFVRALRKVGLLKSVNTVWLSHNRKREFKIPISAGVGAEHMNPIEPFMSQLLTRLFGCRKGTILDIGVHTGETLLKICEIDPERPYIGFEPTPTCVSYVERLIAANSFTNAKIIPTALSNEPGILKLFSRGEDTDGTASIVPGYRQASHYANARYVVASQGDTVLDSLNVKEIAVIKIDVEGAEMDVLNGLSQTLDNHRPLIICEILPVKNSDADIQSMRQERSNSIQASLKKKDYSIFQIRESDAELIELGEFEEHSDFSRCQYFFCPNDWREQVGV